jgi:hypothetical protein
MLGGTIKAADLVACTQFFNNRPFYLRYPSNIHLVTMPEFSFMVADI